MAAGDVAWLTDTIKVALFTSTYVPNYDTDDFYSDLTGEVVSAGYTAGGVTLADKTLAQIASSAVQAWASSTLYEERDIVRAAPDNGNIFLATVAGTSGSSQPAWDLDYGQDTADGSVVWNNAGIAYLRYDAGNASWVGITASPRWSVVYRAGTAGVDDYILGVGDFGASVPVDNGSFDVIFHDTGILRRFVAGA
jgi:hypothetical protein